MLGSCHSPSLSHFIITCAGVHIVKIVKNRSGPTTAGSVTVPRGEPTAGCVDTMSHFDAILGKEKYDK